MGGCLRGVFEPPERWGLTGKQVYLPRGVVIPQFVAGDLWAVKVRCFVGDAPATAPQDSKYSGPCGGQIALYGIDRLRGGDRPLFLVEAELDALLLWQAAGDLIDVAALGSASRMLPARWLATLLPYRHIYAALDADGAGTLNAARLAALSARITPVRTSVGNDVTEFAQQGGDVRGVDKRSNRMQDERRK